MLHVFLQVITTNCAFYTTRLQHQPNNIPSSNAIPIINNSLYQLKQKPLVVICVYVPEVFSIGYHFSWYTLFNNGDSRAQNVFYLCFIFIVFRDILNFDVCQFLQAKAVHTHCTILNGFTGYLTLHLLHSTAAYTIFGLYRSPLLVWFSYLWRNCGYIRKVVFDKRQFF